MNSTAHNVAVRYLTAAAAGDLAKFERLKAKGQKIAAGLPRLLKTYQRNAHRYRDTDPEKAEQLKAAILTKVRDLHAVHADGLRLAQAFSRTYEPTTGYKRGIYNDDFKPWLVRYANSVEELADDFASLYPLTLGLDGGYVAPGSNPLFDAPNAATSIAMYWEILTRADQDPVQVPKGGTDEERFLAFLTPSVRRLAKAVAAKIKKDEMVAGPLVWRILDNVNASQAASVAERLLPGDDAGSDRARKFVTPISKDLSYDVIAAGAFGVALLEEVGSRALADRLTKALSAAFAKDIAA